MKYIVTPITSLEESAFRSSLQAMKALYAGSGSMGTNIYLTEDFDRIANRIIGRRLKKLGGPQAPTDHPDEAPLGTSENPETEIYLIVDQDSGELVGGMEYEYFSYIHCGLIGYMILAKHLWEEKRKDRKSLPKRVELDKNEALVNALKETISKHLLDAEDYAGVKLIFSEAFKPEYIRNENIPATQLNFFKKLGFHRLDLDYIQPPLERSKSPVDKLLLLVFKNPSNGGAKKEHSIQLADFENFYQAMAISTGAGDFFENRIEGIRDDLLKRNGQMETIALDKIPFFELEEMSFERTGSMVEICHPILVNDTQSFIKKAWVLKDGNDVLAGVEVLFSTEKKLAFLTSLYDTEKADFSENVDDNTDRTNLYRLLTHQKLQLALRGYHTFFMVESPFNCVDDDNEDMEAEDTPFEVLDKKLRLFYSGSKSLAKWVTLQTDGKKTREEPDLRILYGQHKELYLLYLCNDHQGFVLKQEAIQSALEWVCADQHLQLLDARGSLVPFGDGQTVSCKAYMPGFYYLKEVPKYEMPGIHIQRGSLCYHLAIDEDYLSPQLLAPRNEDPYCNFFHSFETDLFDFKHQSNPPYFTKRFTPGDERTDRLLGEIKVRFKIKTEYTSEGRVETFFTRRKALKENLDFDGNSLIDMENSYREITFRVLLHFTYFKKSNVRVWHLILRTREDNEVTDLDFIKLIKYFSTLQEWNEEERKNYLTNSIQFFFNDLKPAIGYGHDDLDPSGPFRNDRWQAPNIEIKDTSQLFQTIFHLSGIVYSEKGQNEKGGKNRPLRLEDFEVSSGIVQIDTKYIELNDTDIDLNIALAKMFEHLNEDKSLQNIQGIGLDFQKAAYVFESITGICHGIFDFWRLGIEEISDTLEPVSTSENLFLVLNRGVLGGIAYGEELYNTAWDNIGVSPYLLVPSAVLAHNDCVVRDAELQLTRFLDYYEKIWMVQNHCQGWTYNKLRKDLLGLLLSGYEGITIQKIKNQGHSERPLPYYQAIFNTFFGTIIADPSFFETLLQQWNSPEKGSTTDRETIKVLKSLVPAQYPKQELEMFFRSEKLGDKQLEISRLVENDITPNIFQYSTERGLYEVGMEKRGVSGRLESVKYLMERLDLEKEQLRNREQKQTDVFQEVFLAFIALFGIVSALKDLSDFLDSENTTKKPLLGLVCAIITVALIYILRYYRANRDKV